MPVIFFPAGWQYGLLLNNTVAVCSKLSHFFSSAVTIWSRKKLACTVHFIQLCNGIGIPLSYSFKKYH